MQLLGHEDPNVRYEALIAVQKLMVHNWWVNFDYLLQSIFSFCPLLVLICYDRFREYLGKQLEKETTGATGASGTKPSAQVSAKA